MTLGDAILQSHRTAIDAEDRRNALLSYARSHGVTVTELGMLLGVSRETAWRWSGGKNGKRGQSSGLLADLDTVTSDATDKTPGNQSAPATVGAVRERGNQERDS